MHDFKQFDLPSRLSARGIIAGILVTLVVFSFLMVIAGGFGLWSFGPLDAAAVERMSPGVGIWAAIAWPISNLIGGFVASASSFSPARRGGLLEGVATWAGSFLLGVFLACLWYMSAIESRLATPDAFIGVSSIGASWGIFFSMIFAFVAAVYGGLVGSRQEE